MTYIISSESNENILIKFAPETVTEEIIQNLVMILTTPKFSVPLNRGFGLTQGFADKPVSVAKSLIISEILDAVEKYEPRAKVKNITFKEDSESNKLISYVEVEFNEQ